MQKHPWLEKYPIKCNSTKLIIGTHPPMPHRGCMPFYYGNSFEFWRFMEQVYLNDVFFDFEMKPDLNLILKWLERHKMSITDMIEYTFEESSFSIDSDITLNDYKAQLNQHLFNWLKDSKVNKIYFTSFSEGKSAYDLFRKWVQLHFNMRLPKGRDIINNNNSYILSIFERDIKLIMLYSPSPTARRGIPNSIPYKLWLKNNPKIKNPIDEFRVYWYKKYLLLSNND
jgi:G:T/U-mismatch repair DNA glycosylase